MGVISYEGAPETQVLAWLEDVTGRDHGPDSLADALRDGVALCELANKLKPGVVRSISHSKLPLAQRGNIVAYLSACLHLGVPEHDNFEVDDLLEGEGHLDLVVNQLFALSRAAASLPEYTGPTLSDAPSSHKIPQHTEVHRDMHLKTPLAVVHQENAALRAELGVAHPTEDGHHAAAAAVASPEEGPPAAEGLGPRGLEVLSMGVGGTSEMVLHLLDNRVQFGMLRFDVGSGTFMREKYVFIQYAGPRTSPVKRGRHVGQSSFVKEAMGGAHATMVVSDQADLTVDAVLSRLLSVITADDGNFSLDDLKAHIEAQIAKAAAACAIESHRRVLTAAEMKNHNYGWDVCLKYVTAPDGPFNWILMEPNPKKPTLFNAGAGSVVEMVEWLDTKKVLYGLVRMGFGTGQFARQKWIWVQWSGDDVSAMQRSKGVVSSDFRPPILYLPFLAQAIYGAKGGSLVALYALALCCDLQPDPGPVMYSSVVSWTPCSGS